MKKTLPLAVATLLILGAMAFLAGAIFPRHSSGEIANALSATRVSDLDLVGLDPQVAANLLLDRFTELRPEFSQVSIHFPSTPISRLPLGYRTVSSGVNDMSFSEALAQVAFLSGTEFIEKPDSIYFYPARKCGNEDPPPLTPQEKMAAGIMRSFHQIQNFLP